MYRGCELKYDPLEIMVNVAHNLKLRIEAWINPYRVSQSKDIEELSDNNIAKEWHKSKDKKVMCILMIKSILILHQMM